MAWLLLILAGILEIVWAISLKYSQGFTKFWPSFTLVFTAFLIFELLSLVMKTIPLGTAYAVWAGIGIVGTTLLGILFFHESAHFLRIIFILCILIGIIGLRFIENTIN